MLITIATAVICFLAHRVSQKGWGMALSTPPRPPLPHSGPRLRMSRAMPLLTLCASMVCYGKTLTFIICTFHQVLLRMIRWRTFAQAGYVEKLKERNS